MGQITQHSWPRAALAKARTQARPSHLTRTVHNANLKPNHPRLWTTSPYLTTINHHATTRAKHLTISIASPSTPPKPHLRHWRIVRLTRHHREKSSLVTNRCAEANTDTNESLKSSTPQITSESARAIITHRLELTDDLSSTSLPTRLRLDPPCCSSQLAHICESSHCIVGLRQNNQ